MSSPLSPEMIEKLRRGFPLELDAMGRLLFEGDEISHPRVVELFRRGFDVNDTGEPIVRFEGQWTYLNPRDCPFRVMAVEGAPPALPRLRLDDGRLVELQPTQLVEDAGAGLRTRVPGPVSGRPMWARLTNRAAMQLQPWIDFEEEQAFLVVKGQRFELGEPQSEADTGVKSAGNVVSESRRT